MALLKNSIDSTLSLHAEMFPTLYPQLHTDGITTASFLTLAEVSKAKQLIRDAEFGHVKRNGAAELVKCLQHIDTAKESLLNNLERIKEILNPKPVERRTAEQISSDAKAATQHATVIALTSSFANLPESVLRNMAQVFLGDNQIEYTKEELPKVIATQQVLGTIVEPGQ